ncbi:MAG: helix-turn-helix transcriptional regulator [Lachnospiraceae bacterium]|nr:helix-turn-helix transcriptional regulator [Lachnospiraceae bacterium]
MKMQDRREKLHMSRKELSERTGISFRSLQDYEQGHKDLNNAKAVTIYKLSLALGCTMEELVELEYPKVEKQSREELAQNFGELQADYICYGKDEKGAEVTFIVENNGNKSQRELERKKRFLKYYYALQKIYYEPEKIAARWKFVEETCFLEFMYEGDLVHLPFVAVFEKDMERWLIRRHDY